MIGTRIAMPSKCDIKRVAIQCESWTIQLIERIENDFGVCPGTCRSYSLTVDLSLNRNLPELVSAAQIRA